MMNDQINQKELTEKFAAISSRLITKTIPIIKASYDNIVMVDLLVNLPIAFEFKEVDLADLNTSTTKEITIKDVAVGGYITRDTNRGNPDRLVVFIVFTKDKNSTWDEFFDLLVSDRYFWNRIAFTYLHEAMHILMRHFDYYLNKQYSRIVCDIRPDMPIAQVDTLLNMAFDYWINAYLLEEAEHNSLFSQWGHNPTDFTGLYDANLSPKQMTMHEIVDKLTREAKIEKVELTDTSGNRFGTQTTITVQGNSSTTIELDENHQIQQQGAPDEAEQEVNEVLEGAKNGLLGATRGNQHSGSFTKLGVDYSVPIDWFRALKGSIFKIVQRYTNNYDVSWSKLRKKYRHVAPRPGFIYYDKELAAIISIDQSGSMSNEDLEKINYVVTALAKKTVFTEVLLHDTHVAESKKFIGKQFTGIRDFITNRVACGGTSHREVFQHIDRIKKENPKLKFVYLSFSDNYSDIESVYNEDIFKNIAAYWVTTCESNTVNVPGMQISLENGLLTI